MKRPVLKDVLPLYAGVSHSFVNVVGMAVFVVRDVSGVIKQTRNDYIPSSPVVRNYRTEKHVMWEKGSYFRFVSAAHIYDPSD